jgi:hypothetical protein
LISAVVNSFRNGSLIANISTTTAAADYVDNITQDALNATLTQAEQSGSLGNLTVLTSEQNVNKALDF